MTINGIDHVNLLTDDLETSAAFYEQVLGLSRSAIPLRTGGLRGVWLRDDDGRTVVHLIDRTSAPDRYPGHQPGASTNGFHHVAFACTGFDDSCARLDRLGIAYRAVHFEGMALRQLNVQGPDSVNIELNFEGH